MSDFTALPAPSTLPASAFVADEWTTDRIIVDMSQMMNGKVECASDNYNPCVSQWLKLDTSSMPPSYTLSGKENMEIITKEGKEIKHYTPSEEQHPQSGKRGKKVGIAYELENGEIIYVPE